MDSEHRSGPPDEPSAAELRAAYERQLAEVDVADVIVQAVISLLNLGAVRAGLAGDPEAPPQRDLEQVRLAVEGVRALLPLVEPALGPEAGQLRDVLAQLQMAYAREAQGQSPAASGAQGQTADGGGAPAPSASGEDSSGPGPAESSGRLWIPGR